MTLDEVPIRIVFADYRPAHDSELLRWLEKEATEAEPETRPKDNEDEVVRGKTELYEKPGEDDDELSAEHWGDEPKITDGRHAPFHQHDRTYDESVNVRRGVLGRALGGVPSAVASEERIMKERFQHVQSGDFETHSALLQQGSKAAEAVAERGPTLRERVARLTGGA